MPAWTIPARMAGGLLALVTSLLILVPVAQAAGPTVRFDLSDRAEVSDTVTVVARVTGETDVMKVDFSVDGQSAETDTSTPYSFEWDTLSTTEGEHTLTATATDEAGASGSASIKVVVNNDLGKGADFHANAALAALKSGDTQTAGRLLRRAIKIQPGNLKAARALAGIYRHDGEIDRAIAVLEKADIPPGETEARADLVALHVAKADLSESNDEFIKQMGAAADVFRALQAIRLETVKDGTEMPQVLRRGDLEYQARNWQGALQAYQSLGESSEAPLEIMNRLALTYIQAGRMRDAGVLLRELDRSKRADTVTMAVYGLYYLQLHQIEKARETVQAGIQAGVLPSLLVAAYADMALKQPQKARAEADQAYALAPDLPEVLLLRSYLLPDPLDARKALMRALESDPLLPEAFILRGYQTLFTRDEKRFETADMFFGQALKTDPANPSAQVGNILSLLVQEKAVEAEPLIDKLLAQDPRAPDLYVMRAVTYRQLDKQIKITEQLDTARKLDEARWNYVLVPRPTEIIREVYRYRFSPAISPAALNLAR